MNIKKFFTSSKQRFMPKVEKPVTVTDLDKIISERITLSNEELTAGFNLIKKYPRTVSILGSARFKSDNIYYQQAESLARRIVTELDYAVVTGAGPGIMEAANKGAYEAGGQSIGFAIKLPHEQEINKYLTEYVNFEYFFTRKTLLFFAAETYIYFPGGFGTIDELFELLTLIQTGEISKAPVILVGSDFWTPILDTLKQKLLIEGGTISPEDTAIYHITDSADEIISIIKAAPLRQD